MRAAYSVGVKYAIIIPDGAADLPLDELDGLTPFQSAETPNLDRIALEGRLGTVATTPEGFNASSDVCTMSLLGYDPAQYHTGRAPLEAAALGVSAGPRDWLFRLNLVTTGDPGTPEAGRMLDHSAGAISDAEAGALVRDLVAHWRERVPDLMEGVHLTPGTSYRHILVDGSGRDYAMVETAPPHEIPGEPWSKHMPQGGAGEESGAIRRLMELSAEFLPSHEVNLARREQGLRPATMAWIWGQGRAPGLPVFEDRFGLRGAMLTPVDLLGGLAACLGWTRLEAEGMTGYHDTNDYAAQGRAAVEAMERFDLVCVHVESPDESSHQADSVSKVESIEAIDRHIIGPILERLREHGDPEQDKEAPGWRVLVLPDHYTLVSTRRHDPTPVPFAMAGAWVRSVVQRPFSEPNADAADLHIDAGHDLMEYFLRGGLAMVRRTIAEEES